MEQPHRKALLLLSQHDDIRKLCLAIHEAGASANQRLEFIKKQADDVHKDYNEKTKEIWADIKNTLVSKQLLDRRNYNDKRDMLNFNLDEGCLWFTKDGQVEQGSDLPDFIKRLLT